MMRSLLLGTALLAAGLLLGAAGMFVAQKYTGWTRRGAPPPPVRPADTDEPVAADATCGDDGGQITALARLEPEGGVISVNGTPGDRLETLEPAARLGNHVKKGDLLATLESHALRKTELELATSQLAEAKNRMTAELRYANALLAEAELADKQAALSKLDRLAQQDRIDGLDAAARSAQADLDRLRRVRGAADDAIGAEIVSERQLDHQRLACKKASQELAAAKAELEKLDASVQLAEEQARAKRQTAEANRARVAGTAQLESLEKQVTLAKQRLDLAELRAPSDGQVLKLFIHSGDTLTQMPVLQMADLSRIVANAEIYENDVGRIKPEARACISGDALPAPLLGTLEVIGQMVAKNTVVGLNPTDASDIRVVEARFAVDRVADGAQAAPLNNSAGQLTPGKTYRYQIVHAGGRHGGQSLPSTPIGPIPLSGDHNAIQLERIPPAEKTYTLRRIYRTKADGNAFYLLCEQSGADAQAGGYLDTAADAALQNAAALRPLVNLQVNAAIDASPPPEPVSPAGSNASGRE